MGKIRDFNKGTVKLAMDSVPKELEAFAERYGLVVKVGSGRFSHSLLTMRLELAVASEDGKPVGKDAEAFKHYCFRWNMTEGDLGRTFEQDDGEWKIVGARPRSRRAPIVVEQVSTGDRMRMSARVVKALLAVKG